MTENQAVNEGISGEDFSPGELAYMQSGGTNAGALETELETLLGQRGPSADQETDQAAQERADKAASGPSADQAAQVGNAAAQGSGPSGGPSGPSADQVKNGGEKHLVPVEVLQTERQKRQALEQQLAQVTERFSRADERQKILNELLGDPGGKQAKPQELIDPEKDIFGAFKQLQERYADLQGKTAEVNTRFNQQSEEQQLRQAYHSDATRFMQTAPDFPGAYNHLMQVRDQELSALGIANQQERQAIMLREEQQIAKSALTGGRSAAEVIYNLAKLRGFQAPVTPSADSSAAIGAASAASNQSDAAKQLEAVQKGREAALSLSNAGASAAGELTAQALADMNDDDFERAFSKMSESQRRKMMGG
jgi:hypothetical protein